MDPDSSQEARGSLQQLRERLRALSETMRALANVPGDSEKLSHSVVRQIAEFMGGACTMNLLSEDGIDIAASYAHASDPDLAGKIRAHIALQPRRLDQHPTLRGVVESGQPIIIPHVDPAQSPPASSEFLRETKWKNGLLVPLRAGGRSLGTLGVTRHGDDSPSLNADDLSMSQILADHAALAIANARSHGAEQTAEARAEEKFVGLLEAVPDGMVIVNRLGSIVRINAQAERDFAYPRAELLGQSVDKLVPERFRRKQAAHRASFFAEPKSRKMGAGLQLEGLRKDGSEFPIEVRLSPLETEDGTLVAGAIRDITEQRKVEAKFGSLLESAPDAMVLVARDGRIELVNARTEKLFGYSRDELLGQWVELLVPERHRETHSQHRADNFTHKKAGALGSDLELYGLRKDGSEFPIEISLSRLEVEEGVLVSSIRDISARRQAEEQRSHLAAIVDSSDDAIIGETLDGIITSWNEGAHRIFGYRAEEIVGQPISLLVPVGREREGPEILERLARGRVEHFETVRLRKGGRAIHVSVTSSAMRDWMGNLIGASKVIRDITERRRAETALALANDATEAASRELEAFSYSVAHDLRAPLRGMNGFAQVLLDTYRDKLDADGQDWLQEILLNARTMGALIDALLALARLTRSELHRESVDLSSVVRATVAQLSADDPGRAVELVVEDQLTADLDPSLARALIENLLGNAWKFTGKVPEARIEFGATHEDASPTFFVRDNGAGFDMAFADKLFGAFQRLHTVSEFPGTGIGLATVQRIVRRHGGRVWADGKVDGGATFHFAFPDRASGAHQ